MECHMQTTPHAPRTPSDIFARKETVYAFAKALGRAPINNATLTQLGVMLGELFNPELEAAWQRVNTMTVLHNMAAFYGTYLRKFPDQERDVREAYRTPLKSDNAATALPHRLKDASLRDCCDVLKIYANPCIRPPASVYNAIQQVVMRNTNNPTPASGRDISDILWCHARFGQTPAPEVLHVFDIALPQIIESITHSVDLCNILWSYAKMGIKPDDAVLVAAEQKVKQLFPERCIEQDCSNTLWAFAVFGVIGGDIKKYEGIASFINSLMQAKSMGRPPLSHSGLYHAQFAFGLPGQMQNRGKSGRINLSETGLRTAFTEAGIRTGAPIHAKTGQVIPISFQFNGTSCGIVYDPRQNCVLSGNRKIFGGAAILDQHILNLALPDSQIIRVMPIPPRASSEVARATIRHLRSHRLLDTPLVATSDEKYNVNIHPFKQFVLHRA